MIFAATPTVPERSDRIEIVGAKLHGLVSEHRTFTTPFTEAKRGKPNFIANTRKALAAYLETDLPYFLWIEDDCDIGPRFERCLKRAILSEYPLVTFYNPNKVGLTPAQLKQGPRIAEGLYEVAGRSSYWSSLCLLMTRRCAELMLVEQDLYPDIAIDNLCQTVPVPFYCYLPNPVQNAPIATATPGNMGGKAQSRMYRG